MKFKHCIFLSLIILRSLQGLYADESVNIDNFSVESDKERIIIRATADQNDRQLALLRSENPIENIEDFYSYDWIASLSSATTMTIVDYPPAEIAFYYALLDLNQLLEGHSYGLSASNSSLVAVSITMKDWMASQSFSEDKADTALSPETQNVISIAESLALQQQKALALPEDFIYLTGILAEEDPKLITLHFLEQQNKWLDLIRFCNSEREKSDSELEQAMWMFYQGESYFFNEEWEKSFLYILQSESMFPEEAQPWLNYLLETKDLGEGLTS